MRWAIYVYLGRGEVYKEMERGRGEALIYLTNEFINVTQSEKCPTGNLIR